MARGDDGGHTEARIAELDGRRRARNAYALAIGLSGVTGATAVPLLLSNVDTQAGERHHVLGVRPDDLLGQASFDVMNPEDLPRATADFADALARGKARGTYRCRDKDGRERWIESVYDAVPRGERT